jgi:hypothetical protein
MTSISDRTPPLKTPHDAPSYEALLKAVSMMGFHPQKLADFVASDADAVCKATLLGSLDLSDEKLRTAGAANPDKWRAVLRDLQFECF